MLRIISSASATLAFGMTVRTSSTARLCAFPLALGGAGAACGVLLLEQPVIVAAHAAARRAPVYRLMVVSVARQGPDTQAFALISQTP
ncbi:MAG: hypothetical protein HOV66_07795 [Streptomycetaceae bacterium]|nr:hypothetical protein [Streptomycetaceae bacterium]NUS54751.1 hypothetical protein [Streptomycetaceae bacterium]